MFLLAALKSPSSMVNQEAEQACKLIVNVIANINAIACKEAGNWRQLYNENMVVTIFFSVR